MDIKQTWQLAPPRSRALVGVALALGFWLVPPVVAIAAKVWQDELLYYAPMIVAGLVAVVVVAVAVAIVLWKTFRMCVLFGCLPVFLVAVVLGVTGPLLGVVMAPLLFAFVVSLMFGDLE